MLSDREKMLHFQSGLFHIESDVLNADIIDRMMLQLKQARDVYGKSLTDLQLYTLLKDAISFHLIVDGDYNGSGMRSTLQSVVNLLQSKMI